MEEVIKFMTNYIIEINIISMTLIIALFVTNIVQGAKIKNIQNKYHKIVRGMDNIDIEQLLIKTDNDINEINQHIVEIEKNIGNLDTRLGFCISKVGFIRYNAFDNVGSELSFSIALLDEFQNGFIVTNIYAREFTHSYSKEIKNGESKTQLSAEEILALERAIRGKSSAIA